MESNKPLKDMDISVDSPKEETVKIPILNLRMISDEEWNRLAYLNRLQRCGNCE